MNLEFFIARHIHFQQENKKNMSKPAVRIATIGIAVGLMVMLIAVAVVCGFRKEIQEKIIGFGSHIQVTSFENNNSYETSPIIVDSTIEQTIRNIEGVRHIQKFATKPGIIKTENDFQGIILKGIDHEFDWNFFASNMVEGDKIELHPDSANSTNVVISKILSDMLHLKVGDGFITYFIQNNVKARKFNVVGIYSTDFKDFDKMFILCDLRQVQKLNDWERDEFSGIEVLVNNYKQTDLIADKIHSKTANRFDDNGGTYYTRTIQELNPQIFSWLNLLNTNVLLILILMSLVAGFNMISGLLILILERTNMIGVLKAMGMNNTSIRKIFLYQSIFLIGKGLLYGNILGFIVCFIQKQFGIISMNPDIYYLSEVPILFNPVLWILINVFSFIISMLMLLGPSYMITKIKPSKSIKFE